MRIAIGSDHRGIDLKKAIVKILAELDHSYHDFGPCITGPVDYPDIALAVAEAVVSGDFDCGILICNTGIGMSIAANKVRGARAALCGDASTARLARQHNDANILCLAKAHSEEFVREILTVFLNSTFEGGHHSRRLDKIKAMEDGLSVDSR